MKGTEGFGKMEEQERQGRQGVRGKQEMREMRAKGEKLSIVETNGKGE